MRKKREKAWAKRADDLRLIRFRGAVIQNRRMYNEYVQNLKEQAA